MLKTKRVVRGNDLCFYIALAMGEGKVRYSHLQFANDILSNFQEYTLSRAIGSFLSRSFKKFLNLNFYVFSVQNPISKVPTPLCGLEAV